MKCTKIALATLFAGMMVASVSADNSPYLNEDFESYTIGNKITAENATAWKSGEQDESIVTTNAVLASGKLLQINTEGDVLTNNIANPVDITVPADGVYMDAKIQFVPSDDLADIKADNTLKLALYAYLPDPDADPNHPNPTLVVYHSYQDGEGEYHQVSTDTGFVVDTGVLQRVVVTLKKFEGSYLDSDPAYAFQVMVGGTVVTSTYAYAAADLEGDYLDALDGETCGEWFLTANLHTGSAEQKSTVASLAFSGTGYVDDLSLNEVENNPSEYTITFVDENGTTVLQTGKWDVDAVPSYTNATPTKAADATGIYTFAGWTPAITNVTADATYTATYTSVVAVASVDGTYYASLAAAIAAASNGGTVVLNGDVTASWPTVLEGESVVIDLAGHTLTANVDVYGELLLTNSVPATGALAGTVYVNGNDVDTADVVAHFTLAEDTAINAAYGIILYQAEGTHAAYDAQIDILGTVNGCVWVMGNITEGDSEVNVAGTINAVGIEGIDIGIALNGVATVNVYEDALIVASDLENHQGTGIEVRAGELNVYGGTIVGTGSSYAFDPNGNGTSSYGVGIAVAQHTTAQDINVNVEGGSITGVVAFATANPQQNANGSLVVDISGGEFIGIGANAIAVDSDDARINGFVSGGSFSSVLDADYCAEGYEPVTEPNADGLYTVQPIATYEITVSVTGGTISTGNVAVATGTTLVVPAGTEIAFAATDTYKLSSVTTNDIAVTGIDTTATSYTYTVGDSDATVAVVFVAPAVADDYEAGNTIGTETLDADMAVWLNGKKNAAGKTKAEYNDLIAADTDSLSLVDEYLLNTDPTVNTTVAFSITSIAVGSTVDVNITLTRTENSSAVESAINGTLKIKGAAAVAGPYTDDQSLTDKFNGVTTATKSFSTENKFFKAVIE